MERKHLVRALPSTSLSTLTILSSIYRDNEPPRKKPRVAETPQYTRSNRRSRDFPKMERRVTRSQSSSRSHSPPNIGIHDQIEVAWWDSRVTESSASSDGKTSAKRATTRSMTRSLRVSAPKKAKVNRDSLTEEDMVDDHDPRMSEDYVPFSPPLAKENTRERNKRAPKVNDESKKAKPPSDTGSIQGIEILMARRDDSLFSLEGPSVNRHHYLTKKTQPIQSLNSMAVTGDYIPFSPDSPVITRHHQNVNSPERESFSKMFSTLRTRIGNESPVLVDQYDGAATDVIEEQTPAPQTEEELLVTGSDAAPSQIEDEISGSQIQKEISVGTGIWQLEADSMTSDKSQEEVSATNSQSPPTPEADPIVPQTQGEVREAGRVATPLQLRAGSGVWNPVFLTMKDGGARFDQLWPARSGGVYCEACFRDQCIRWIRIRDKVVRVFRLLGGDGHLREMNSAFYRSGDETLLTNHVKAPKPIVWPDHMNNRVDRLFHKTPSDMMGLVLLRILAGKRVTTLEMQSRNEVTETLSSLCRDIGASKGQLDRLERQCETLVETSGVANPKKKSAIPKNVAWLWEFDSLLQSAESRFSIERYIGSCFATTVTLRAREAAIAEIWARAVAARGGRANMFEKFEESLDLSVQSGAFLSSIAEAVAEASSKSEQEQEGRVGTRNAFPCRYCAESEVVNVRDARSSKGQVVQDNPWIKSLIWSYEMTAETASKTMAEEFFRLVKSRGAAVADVPGIKFLVDSTGGERRIVLVEMASVFEGMWKERLQNYVNWH